MTLKDIAKFRLLNQLLLNPCFDSPADIVSWMGAIQAQEYRMFRWAVGIRMAMPDIDRVSEAINNRKIVCGHLNRATWQLVAAEDVRWMMRLYGERNRRIAENYYRREIVSGDLTRYYGILVRALEGGKSLTCEEIVAYFRNYCVGETVEYVRELVKHLMRLAEADSIVCGGDVKGRYHTYSLLDERFPDVVDFSKDEALMLMARKYFRSHAPATIDDFRWWSGLTAGECKIGMSLIEKELDSFSFSGVTYYIHESNRSGRMSNSLVHFLPSYDEILLGYKNRIAVLPDKFKGYAQNSSGIFYPVVMYGGRIIGNWNVRKNLVYDFFDDSSVPCESDVKKAVKRLKAFGMV